MTGVCFVIQTLERACAESYDREKSRPKYHIRISHPKYIYLYTFIYPHKELYINLYELCLYVIMYK